MLQLIIQGRGGQGAQLAGKIMADMFFKEGKDVLVYATYGGARRGTPVSSSLRFFFVIVCVLLCVEFFCVVNGQVRFRQFQIQKVFPAG